MKRVLMVFVSNIVAMILASMAFWMAQHNQPYFGWVILAAVAVTVYPKNVS